MKINKEEIAGYVVGEQTVCPECIAKEETDGLKLENYLLQSQIEKDEADLFFCDRCGREIV